MKHLAAGVTIAVLVLAGGSALEGSGQSPVPPSTPVPSPAPPQPSAPSQQPVTVDATMQAPAPGPAAQGRSTIIEKVLVRVNGEIFTQSELTQRQVDVIREANQGQPVLTDERLQAELARITPLILVDVVDDLLLVQRGREMGVKFTEQDFTRAIENLKKDNNLNDAQLKEAVAQQGITFEQLRQNFERAAMRSAVTQREIGPSMTITQEEQRQYYASNRAKFMTPETVTLRQLLVPVTSRSGEGGQPADPVAEAAAKVRIADLRAKAVAGADFAQLVRDNSAVDSPMRTTGGLVGPVKVEELNPALKDAILSLKPGEVSEPIRTPGGFQILKLEMRTVSELRPFDSVRSEVENAIRNERLEPETKKMVDRLRAQAVIEWKDENYRKMYETARNQRDDPSPAAPLPPPPPVRQ